MLFNTPFGGVCTLHFLVYIQAHIDAYIKDPMQVLKQDFVILAYIRQEMEAFIQGILIVPI